VAALADLSQVAARLSGALDGAAIPHVVSGAVAMAAHGFVRATQDLDLLVIADAVRLPQIFGMVRDLGFAGEDAALLAALRDRYVATLRAGPIAVEILVPVLPYHRTLCDRAVRRPLHGHDVPFVTVEDLIVLKMLWRRAKDVPDVQALIAASADLDGAYVRGTLQDILPSDDGRHAELADWLERFRPPGRGRAAPPA
jgi:hypothetical protein